MLEKLIKKRAEREVEEEEHGLIKHAEGLYKGCVFGPINGLKSDLEESREERIREKERAIARRILDLV